MRRLILLLIACLPSASCGGTNTSTPPPGPTQSYVEPSVRFCQYDYVQLGDYRQMDSPHGAAIVTFEGAEGIWFLNLATQVDGRDDWQIQNLPIVGCGGLQTVWVPVDLRAIQAHTGDADVQRIDHACTVSALALSRAPWVTETANVEDQSVRFQTGIAGGVAPQPGPWRPDFQFEIPIGTLEADAACHAWYPNQEAGVGECVPTAVSNGLKFLGVGAGANDIEDCKALTGWPDCTIAWPSDKTPAVAGPPYDVTTVELYSHWQGPARIIDNFRQVIAAIRAGAAIEMYSFSHCVSVIAAAEIFLSGGSLYVLHVAHDIDQGNAGGLVVETLILDPDTGDFTGWSIGGETVLYSFVVQTK